MSRRFPNVSRPLPARPFLSRAFLFVGAVIFIAAAMGMLAR